MRHPRLRLGALGGLVLCTVLTNLVWAQSSSSSGEKRGSAPSDDKNASASKKAGRSGDKTPALRLRAFAVDQNAVGTAAATAGTLDIVIERWSTDAERDSLRDVLAEKGGGDALLSAVKSIKPRAGYIRGSGSLGWDIQFARESQLPDGSRRIVIGTDRPMSFWETANRPRSADYEYLLAEIRLGKDGKGQGTLVPAALVDYDEDTHTIEVENYQQQPVLLSRVEVVK